MRICVFCGSSPGRSPAYAAAARELGSLLARRGIGLVYGGGNVGLMGILADAVLAEGGEVIGVILTCGGPGIMEAANRGAAEARGMNVGLTISIPVEEFDNLYVTRELSFHFHYFFMRKFWFAYLAKAVIVFPGGYGTLDELFEALTWAQLGVHQKPLGLLDVDGFWQPLRTLVERQVAELFVRPHHAQMLLCADAPQTLLDQFAAYKAPDLPKWIGRPET